MSSYSALTLICNILSFKSDNDSLKRFLKEEDVDWELIVKIASKHLVLPALYSRLITKQLIHFIPKDLESYLKEITNLNYQRNRKLLEEVDHISTILKKNNINHVFLKGAAMLALNSYTNISERMIGDIDILVENTQLKIAFNILKKEHYKPVELTLGSKYFDNKHLPRLIPEKSVIAIELHKKLLKKKSEKYLNTNNILSNKIITKNGIYIPSKNHLIKHVIYNYQINDDGHFYGTFNLRSLYDAISLLNQKECILKIGNKYSNSYLLIGGLLFDDLKIFNQRKNLIKRKWFQLKLSNKYINTLSLKINKNLLKLNVFISRSLYFITNSSYRIDIIKDRKRIFQQILNGKTIKKM